MSTEVLDYHANVMPTHLRLNLTVFKFAPRRVTLPPTHPLHKAVKCCKRVPRYHRWAIHRMILTFPVLTRIWETIGARTVAYYKEAKGILTFRVAESKAEALEEATAILQDRICIFTAGSAFKAGIAWREESDHTGFEAELVGLLLALDIIENTPYVTKATILLDLQAAILAIADQEWEHRGKRKISSGGVLQTPQAWSREGNR
ncbi:hypothetical protein BDZ89DRAFT_1249659 [Hymenopellis radicata]|nr:hypothetical protein BDZ89DRAFT_1249659 [Hymenopellis radicata]